MLTLIIGEGNFDESQIFIWHKTSTPRDCLLAAKEKNSSYPVEKSNKTLGIKLTSSMRRTGPHMPLEGCPEKHTIKRVYYSSQERIIGI